PAQILAGAARALDGAREGERDVQREDPLVARQLLVGREEVGRRRLRRRRELPRRAQPLVELARGELDVVAEALLAEPDVERDEPPVRVPGRPLREVRRRVEDDRGVRGVEQHQDVAAEPAASRTAATRTSSGSSLPTTATAPASSIPSTSRSPAAAVRPTIATSGHAARTRSVTFTPSRPGRR